jgi:hypothetical protein
MRLPPQLLNINYAPHIAKVPSTTLWRRRKPTPSKRNRLFLIKLLLYAKLLNINKRELSRQAHPVMDIVPTYEKMRIGISNLLNGTPI